jgi:hypothetical protein
MMDKEKIEMAFVLEGVVGGGVMISGNVIDDSFFAPKHFKRECDYHIVGKQFECWVDERCTSGLSREKVIKACHWYIEKHKSVILAYVESKQCRSIENDAWNE